MSNTKKVVLIVTGVLVVCLIGAGIILGLYFSQGGDGWNFVRIFEARSRVTVDETHALDLDGVSSLKVECPSGTVRIQPGDEPGVVMTGAVLTPNPKDEYLRIEKNDGRLSVVLDLDTQIFNWSDLDITVTLPKDCGLNLDLSCASANSTIENLNFGDISVSCASGRTSITNCTGGALDVSTASGGVDIEECEFTTIHTVCQSGNINIRNSTGSATVRCTSGRVEITDVVGALDISNTSGGVTVDLSQTEIEPISIDVTSGSLTVYLSADAAFDLDADTTSGSISCDFDRTVSGGSSGSIVGDHVSGSVNGGGVSVTLRTVSGGINIKKQ